MSPFLKYLLSFTLNMSASSGWPLGEGGATRTGGAGDGGVAAALVGESGGRGVTQAGGGTLGCGARSVYLRHLS